MKKNYKAKPLKDLVSNMAADEQQEAKAIAKCLLLEYNLKMLRKKLGFNQTTVAENLQISQVSISKMEKQSDMLLSTLSNYVESMGGELEIYANLPEGEKVKLAISSESHTLTRPCSH